MRALGKLVRSLVVAALLCAGAVQAQTIKYLEHGMWDKRVAGLLGGVGGVEWISWPQANGQLRAYYRVPGAEPTYYDRFQVRDNPVTQTKWMFQDAFCNHKLNDCDSVRSVRTRVKFGGQWFDMPTPAEYGQPYAPLEFEGQYEVMSWATSAGTRYFHHGRYTPGPCPINPSAPIYVEQGALAAPPASCIKQEEIWWDAVGGWEVGSGPLGLDGSPTGEHTGWGRTNYMAKGLGWWGGSIGTWQTWGTNFWSW